MLKCDAALDSAAPTCSVTIPPKRRLLIMVVPLACLFITGCVRRTITVTSDPSGALVWLNGREVGRTPVTVDFLYYGTYDVQLVADDCEPLLTKGQANAPWWDHVPLDFAAEVTPGEKHSRIAWHYQLTPRQDDPQALLERARQLRDRVPQEPAQPQSEPAAPAQTAPTSQ